MPKSTCPLILFLQALTTADIRKGSEWMYSFFTEGGGKYSAWFFDNGSVRMEGLFDLSCVSRVTKVFMANQIQAVYFMYNINHVQPDLTELEAKLALAQDPVFCP
ncbi:hypothetical protein PoB_005632700 [Plakobranchus ocellatus]|uniref:Uncharacterized protein n=1 Tax=Plakobranchus ocellatus TaxID=259542 RepID=A0AAV4CF13_9GAST|nr:hypothetical protein PoB_005632700 [Plakobranchus ocellatus]